MTNLGAELLESVPCISVKIWTGASFTGWTFGLVPRIEVEHFNCLERAKYLDWCLILGRKFEILMS